jgi:hypothetical protein
MEQIDLLTKKAITQKTFPGAVIGYINNDQKHVNAYGHLTYDAESKKVTTQIFTI